MRRYGLGLAFVVLCLTVGYAQAAERLMVYTSMKESMFAKLRDDFSAKHPDVALDYYSAGAGKLMAKIAAERESGHLTVDVLWHSEVPDFIKLAQEGMFEKYISPEAVNVRSSVKSEEGYFTPVRNGTLGIAYNTRLVSAPPQEWSDLQSADFKGAVAIANPALSGTAFVTVSMLLKEYGWGYFEKLKANGAMVGHGSGQVVNDTASGDYLACISPDYIAFDKIDKGATLNIAFPQKMAVVPSPVAIFKGTPNLAAAKKFVDYLLSKDGQQIVADSGTLPVRDDVTIPARYHLPKASEAIARALPLDFAGISPEEKETTIKRFEDLMR